MSGIWRDEDELSAAELALGLSAGEERLEAQARVAAEPAFAAAYHRWQAWAEEMFLTPPAALRPSLWPAIEQRLPANDLSASPAGGAWGWKLATAASIALATGMGWIALQKPPAAPAIVAAAAPAPTAPLVAVLTGKDGGVLTITVRDGEDRVTSAPNGLHLGQHAAQLWVIPDGQSPRSLGVIGAAAPGWNRLPAGTAANVHAGVTLAVSVEPLGGSPTGQPTGAVILTGKLSTI